MSEALGTFTNVHLNSAQCRLLFPCYHAIIVRKNIAAARYTNILTTLAAQTVQYTMKLHAFKNDNLPVQFLGRNHWPLRMTRGS